MAGTEQEPAYLTFSYRGKDATSGKHLVALGNATNTAWNYCNEISERSARRGPKWATKKQLRDLTKGASKELGLPSQVIQEIIDEFIAKRKRARRPKLRPSGHKNAKKPPELNPEEHATHASSVRWRTRCLDQWSTCIV
ncbi:hypothetical protein [Microvirga sp. VF16]|uniref:hypothetical protein n=1 Tax=Microvirga sp. VF16 TaxID=2807101 RepID=UPI00193DB858|nr:hypothetical protein [Microvirga sp. VF16]QRM35573.1 hypothetical protein JO965_45435 [Microvirga sp. VF16]